MTQLTPGAASAPPGQQVDGSAVGIPSGGTRAGAAPSSSPTGSAPAGAVPTIVGGFDGSGRPSTSNGDRGTPTRPTWRSRTVLGAAMVGLLIALAAVVVAQPFRQSALANRIIDLSTTAAQNDQEINALANEFGSNAPDLTVLTYLRHLAAGEAQAALAMVPSSDSQDPTPVMTDEFYAAFAGRPAQPIVTAVKYDADRSSASVAASYTVGGQSVSQRYEVVRARDGAWKLTSGGAVVVQLSADRAGSVFLDSADVSAYLTPAEGGGLAGSVAVLPGAYTVSYQDPGGTWESQPVALTVSGDAKPATVTLATTISQAAIDFATGQAQAVSNSWMDACVASRLTGETCSPDVRAEGGYIADKVVTAIVVETYPPIALTWDPAQGAFTYTAEGTIRVDGQGLEGGAASRWTAVKYHGVVALNGDGTIGMSQAFD